MSTHTPNFNLPILGAGAGLRHAHFDVILEKKPPFAWFEIILDDFLDFGGRDPEMLFRIQAEYPVIPHGVCLSIGSTDPLDVNYLKRVKLFLDKLKAPWYSDHLCFTMVDHTNLNDLIPLPFTSEAVKHLVERIKIVQDIIERPFLVENVTRYITVSDREMSESEFLCSILEKANCGLLLDVTNVYLNSRFHGYNADAFIDSLPLHRVGQMHLAGWEPGADGKIIDSHDAPVPPEVLELFERTITKTGPTSVLVEWDNLLPPMERLLEETRTVNAIMHRACGLVANAA